MMEEFVKWFEDLRIEDVPSVGGKNASLGEMIRNLKSKDVSVPGGFAVTAYAYKYTIEKEGVDQKIKEILSDLNTHDVRNIAERGEKIRSLIKNTQLPEEVSNEIRRYYQRGRHKYFRNPNNRCRFTYDRCSSTGQNNSLTFLGYCWTRTI